MLDLVTLNMIRQTFAVHDNISNLLHQNLKKLSKLNCVAIEMEKEDTQGQTKRPHIPNSKYSEQQGQTGKASKKKVTDCRAVTVADFYHRGGNGPTTAGGAVL